MKRIRALNPFDTPVRGDPALAIAFRGRFHEVEWLVNGAWDVVDQPTLYVAAVERSDRRHWRRLLSSEALQMQNAPHDSHDLLSELTRALRRVPGTAVGSLHGLRNAVFRFAERDKRHGLPLEDSILGVHRELMAAEDEVMSALLSTEPRDPALARQVRAWCSEGYRNPPGEIRISTGR